MRTKIYLFAIVLLFLNVGLISKGWSQNEQVHGYYDSTNDWFVFEWNNPEYGRMKTIYDPANKIKPLIKARVEFNENEQEYTYSYEVTNQEGAIQLLYKIFIKHLTSIYNAKAPSPEDAWHMGEYRDKNAWEWAKTGGTIHGIPSGQTEKGFSFKSKGLPTIVNSAFTGERRAEFSGPGDSDTQEVIEAFNKLFDEFKEKYKEKFGGNVIKKTLGPTAPPADFKPVDFLNYIVTMKHEAFSLGWITNQGIEQSLDAKLENAKRKLEQGNTNAAKNVLEAFINEVEAQGCSSYENCSTGKHLTSEAYALLKYNTQYLIDQLGGEKKKEDESKKE